MRLNEVRISNFRSIQNVTIKLDPACRILVGINESGKSNLLRALALIAPENVPNPEDLREPLPKEKDYSEAYVRFVFHMEKDDHDAVYANGAAQLLSADEKQQIISIGSKRMSFHEFCSSRSEALYSVDLMGRKKYGSFWSLSSGSVLPHWMKPSSACPEEYTVEVNGQAKALKSYALVYQVDFPSIPKEYLVPVTAADVNNLAGRYMAVIVEKSLPKVVNWKYDESHLLPSHISMDEFAADPNTCQPLKSMFLLAGISRISDELNRVRGQPGNKLRNLLQRVAGHATDHFREVWKEYGDVRFGLEPNANSIEANIVEKNYWRMSQRSDGFKRFMAFLLYVSANVKTNNFANVLLLIDEPDIGLHPSGTRFLRDELIAQSKKNFVVLSTHSIFMIDKDCISRHIIVEKDNEKTTVKSADISNFVDEEVLFNALNHTVFDVLKKNNIVFEGWRDKRLFQVAISKLPAAASKQLKSARADLREFGSCHADGVKDIKNISPLLELAGRSCFILSDSDDASRSKQKEYIAARGYGIWKRYDEISPINKADTGEDFISEAAFVAAMARLKVKHASLAGDPAISQVGRLAAVRAWLAKQGVSGSKTKELLSELKYEIFDELEPEHIDGGYYDFLVVLAKELKS